MIHVKRTLHHGNTYKQSTDEIEDSFESFCQFLQRGHHPLSSDVATNKYAREAYDKLLVAGKSEFGWERFEIIKQQGE